MDSWMLSLVDYLEYSILEYNKGSKTKVASKFADIKDFIIYLMGSRWSEKELRVIGRLTEFYYEMDWISINNLDPDERKKKKEYIENRNEYTWLWDELYYCYYKGKWTWYFIDSINRVRTDQKNRYIWLLEDKISSLQDDEVIDYNSMDYSEYLQTDYWKTLSKQCKEEAWNKCKLCNSSKNLNTHHRSYKNRWLVWEKDDLIVLCNKCHAKFHDK